MNTVKYFGGDIAPTKIICIGRNYAEHARELGNEVPDEMVMFIKPNSAISPNLYAHKGEPLHYETEIVFMVLGGQLAAVGVGLDLTKRELQSQLKAKALPWERAKAFDGAAVFSGFAKLPADSSQLNLKLDVNTHARQRGNISQMLFSPATIMAELSQHFSWQDGDLIMTGTPKGVGVVEAGALYEASIYDGEALLQSAQWQAQ